jgi:hypothetical protein
MRPPKSPVALAAVIAALAAASATDSASAGLYSDGYRSYFTSFNSYSLYRAPQPGQSPPGAMSHPGNGMRAAPYVGGRRMRGIGAPVGGMRGRR